MKWEVTSQRVRSPGMREKGDTDSLGVIKQQFQRTNSFTVHSACGKGDSANLILNIFAWQIS